MIPHRPTPKWSTAAGKSGSSWGITVETSGGASIDDAEAAARDHCRRHAARPVLGYTAFDGDNR